MSSSLSQRRMAGRSRVGWRSRARRESVLQTSRRSDLFLQRVFQEVEVEAVHDLENRKFPIEVDCHRWHSELRLSNPVYDEAGRIAVQDFREKWRRPLLERGRRLKAEAQERSYFGSC